jgi:hypothetical protein
MPAPTNPLPQAIAANFPIPELSVGNTPPSISASPYMPDANKTRERFEKLSAICLGFPQALREDQGSHASFKVGKKTFAYYLNDHHGDGIVSICCKVLPGDNARLIAANPRKFYMPAYIGPRGWVALRLDRPTVDWAEVKELLQSSYAQIAPKKLLRLIEQV